MGAGNSRNMESLKRKNSKMKRVSNVKYLERRIFSTGKWRYWQILFAKNDFNSQGVKCIKILIHEQFVNVTNILRKSKKLSNAELDIDFAKHGTFVKIPIENDKSVLKTRLDR